MGCHVCVLDFEVMEKDRGLRSEEERGLSVGVGEAHE